MQCYKRARMVSKKCVSECDTQHFNDSTLLSKSEFPNNGLQIPEGFDPYLALPLYLRPHSTPFNSSVFTVHCSLPFCHSFSAQVVASSRNTLPSALCLNNFDSFLRSCLSVTFPLSLIRTNHANIDFYHTVNSSFVELS